MKIFRFLTILFFIFTSCSQLSFATLADDRLKNIDNAKNYIILLVHGTGDDSNCFGNVYDYLNKSVDNGGLGLNGYVYKYAFSDKFGSIKTWAKELRGWLEKAKNDFSHNSINKDKATPNDFILICHSAGGLAARYYVMGKDENGQPFYTGGVKKIITIDTPHTGSQAGEAVIWAEKNEIERFAVPWFMLGLSAFPFDKGTQSFLVSNAVLSLASQSLDMAAFGLMDRHSHQPIVKEQAPDSSFLNELNNIDSPPGTTEAPIYSLIVGRGVPTPSMDKQTIMMLDNAILFARLTSSLSNIASNGKQSNYEEKLMSMNLTLLTGYPFFEDGDLISSVDSQKGFGIKSLSSASIYEHEFRSPSISLLISVVDTALITSYFLPGPAAYMIALSAGLSCGLCDDARQYLFAHNAMKDYAIIEHPVKYASFEGLQGPSSFVQDINEPTMLEQALFELPVAGSSTKISLSQAGLILSTNLTKEGSEIKTLSDYHAITIEAMKESNTLNSLPIVIEGKDKYVQSVTVKEAPTKITGVLRDFMPQKMQYFQYSENFSVWKDIKILDEWGNFEITGLKFGEGQNVIAFRGENKVGYTSNQQLLITLNTIPMQASEFYPTPGIYTNNPQPTVKFKEGKASYSSASVVSISLKTAKLICGSIEVDITADMKTKIGGGAYDKHMEVEYTPLNRLDDGHYVLIAVFESNIGSNQVVTDFYVDTQAPMITMEKFKSYSPRSPTNIKYSISDNLSPVIKTASCILYDSNNNLITTISNSDTLSLGDGFSKWNGTNEAGEKISDGSYKVRIKAFDLAGNYSTTEESLAIDSTPPLVTDIAVTPNPVSSKASELKLSGNVTEKSAISIRLTNTSTKKVTAYLTTSNSKSPSGDLGAQSFSYTWKFGDSLSPDLEDGVYNIEVTVQDDAENVSSLVTLESVLIDRTPPTITKASAMPYVLMNSGTNKYKTTLSYKVMTNDKFQMTNESSNPNQEIKVKVKLYNSNTGELVYTWENASNSLTEENQIAWNANSSDLTLPPFSRHSN